MFGDQTPCAHEPSSSWKMVMEAWRRRGQFMIKIVDAKYGVSKREREPGGLLIISLGCGGELCQSKKLLMKMSEFC